MPRNDLKARIPVLRFEFGLCKRNMQGPWHPENSRYKTLHYYCLHGTTSNPSTFGQRKLTQVDFAFIRDMIAQHHSLYLDEIQEELLAHRGTLVSIPTLAQALCRLDFLHKKVSARALERNEIIRTAFIGTEVPDPAMLMFTDQMVKDEQTSSREIQGSCPSQL